MRTWSYPDRPGHLLEHRRLIEQLDILLDGIDLLTGPALIEAIGFMDRWFTDHVVGSDARLGAYLRASTASAA
jgi:hemerythrin